MKRLAEAAIQTLKKFNIAMVKQDSLQRLMENNGKADDIELLLKLPDKQVSLALRHLKKSQAQLRQDIFVLSEVDFMKNGFFVEFGATNGINLSNTYLLESDFGWSGILSEPARIWHDDLCKNRKSSIETRCVWSDSDHSLVFNEVEKAEFSTIDTFNSSDFDHHARNRKNSHAYEIKTISLLDLLIKHNAPKIVDYLSIDTEGSEFQILSSFDFSKYQFRVITCEHNFTPEREEIYKLLTSHGYVRKFEDISKFDDWYVKAEA